MTTATTLREWLDVARATATEAAALALSGYRSGTAIHKKGRIDLVTQYDLECERLIRDRLARALPSHRIVGEEGEAQGEGELVWYVDPIDGTTNFAHGHPFFCVSIGLYERGLPLVGVVSAPALGVTWSGARGLGAFRNDAPCRVTTTATLEDSLAATGFSYNHWAADDDNVAEHRAFLKRTQGVRRCGAAALDLALVADGTYDLYWEQNLKPWDVAAGMLLVLEAGGRVTSYAGTPAEVGVGQVVATNGVVHDATLAVLAEARTAAGFGQGANAR